MREKLIELLKGFSYDISSCENCERNKKECEICENEDLADYLLEKGVVVLPCGIGDVVYYIGYSTCHNGENLPDSYGCCGCNDECDMKKIIKSRKVPSLTFIVDKFIDHNGEYYLTKEEAEKVLERIKQND